MIGEKLFDYARDVYGPRLADGLAYQDHVMEQLHRAGIILQPFSSKRAQQEKGENLLGLEIKYDKRLSETGNLYIETHERSHPDRPELVPSGIYRTDRCWLYGIGDFSRFFIFGKRALQRLAAKLSTREIRGVRKISNGTATSKGFLLEEALARELAERVFNFKEQEKE